MESQEEVKKCITDAKNICIIPSSNDEGEGVCSALALFYTLKELGKNVNIIMPDIPEKLNFLVPSLDFISSPKNFVISIPKDVAEISSVYYEKNDANLRIHLTIDKGTIKKDNISFYFSEAKPDLVVTLGIKDFQSHISEKLDSFGFILDAPIVNIDSESPLVAEENKNKLFGKINIVKDSSLAEISHDIVSLFHEHSQQKNTADCLLTGLILHCGNFQNANTTAQIFELCAKLMKQGANRQQIVENLHHGGDNKKMQPGFIPANSELVS